MSRDRSVTSKRPFRGSLNSVLKDKEGAAPAEPVEEQQQEDEELLWSAPRCRGHPRWVCPRQHPSNRSWSRPIEGNRTRRAVPALLPYRRPPNLSRRNPCRRLLKSASPFSDVIPSYGPPVVILLLFFFSSPFSTFSLLHTLLLSPTPVVYARSCVSVRVRARLVWNFFLSKLHIYTLSLFLTPLIVFWEGKKTKTKTKRNKTLIDLFPSRFPYSPAPCIYTWAIDNNRQHHPGGDMLNTNEETGWNITYRYPDEGSTCCGEGKDVRLYAVVTALSLLLSAHISVSRILACGWCIHNDPVAEKTGADPAGIVILPQRLPFSSEAVPASGTLNHAWEELRCLRVEMNDQLHWFDDATSLL